MSKCQWIGHGQGCSNDIVKDRSYCEDHIWIVYQKGTALGKRRKDLRTVDQIRILDDLMNQAIQELELEGYL